ncbi:unnamed protein product [Gordionus sp. m RMFG-2023]
MENLLLNDTISKSNKKVVRFPNNDSIVSAYIDPPNPWKNDKQYTNEEILIAYENACKKLDIKPLLEIILQIKALPIQHIGRLSCLHLKNLKLNCKHVEALEEVLNRVRFVTIDLENALKNDEACSNLLESIEYYESCLHLVLRRNRDAYLYTWKSLCHMIRKSSFLETLDCSNSNLMQFAFLPFARSVKLNHSITTLDLSNCNLSGKSLTFLVSGLKGNHVLRNLYLKSNRLVLRDILILRELLSRDKNNPNETVINDDRQVGGNRSNVTHFDLSFNPIQDMGFKELCSALLFQICRINFNQATSSSLGDSAHQANNTFNYSSEGITMDEGGVVDPNQDSPISATAHQADLEPSAANKEECKKDTSILPDFQMYDREWEPINSSNNSSAREDDFLEVNPSSPHLPASYDNDISFTDLLYTRHSKADPESKSNAITTNLIIDDESFIDTTVSHPLNIHAEEIAGTNRENDMSNVNEMNLKYTDYISVHHKPHTLSLSDHSSNKVKEVPFSFKDSIHMCLKSPPPFNDSFLSDFDPDNSLLSIDTESDPSLDIDQGDREDTDKLKGWTGPQKVAIIKGHTEGDPADIGDSDTSQTRECGNKSEGYDNGDQNYRHFDGFVEDDLESPTFNESNTRGRVDKINGHFLFVQGSSEDSGLIDHPASTNDNHSGMTVPQEGTDKLEGINANRMLNIENSDNLINRVKFGCVSRLVLVKCQLSFKSMAHLDYYMSHPLCQLRSLNLSDNSIGDKGISLLKSCLLKNISLKRLVLNQCKLSDESAITLAEILGVHHDNIPFNSSRQTTVNGLSHLDLRSNPDISLAGVLALAKAMKYNRSILYLALFNNDCLKNNQNPICDPKNEFVKNQQIQNNNHSTDDPTAGNWDASSINDKQILTIGDAKCSFDENKSPNENSSVNIEFIVSIPNFCLLL